MRSRSRSFSGHIPPQHGIDAIAHRFRIINPFGGTNPHGRCIPTAVEVATVLTTPNREPHKVNDNSPDDLDAGNGTHVFQYALNRPSQVLTWLSSGDVAPGSVFTVDMDAMVDGDDAVHAWNYVRGPDPQPTIYLIDASTYVFKEIRHAVDFVAMMTEDINDPMGPFNYASPDELLNQDLTIYYWGQLTPRWTNLLRKPRPGNREAPV